MEATETKRKPERRNMRGQGSIIKRNGRFAGVLSLGKDASGKRLRRWIYGDTKTEVANELTRLKGQKLDGNLAGGSKTTVGAWLDLWLETVINGNRRESTYAAFKNSIETHIKPSLVGGLKLSQLTACHLDALYADMRRAGKSSSVQRMAHAVLHLALKAAKRKRLVPFNAASEAEAPAVAKREMVCLDADQAGVFLKAAERNRLYALFVLALTTGMRQGEMLGLKRADLDLDAGILHVRRTLVEIDHKRFIENEPKTEKGKRDIELPPMTVEALRDHLARMLADGNAGATYIFCNRMGGPMRRGTLQSSTMPSILKAAKLPKMRFHDLRHTHITMLLRDGENINAVAARAGHSDVRITLGTYGHVLPGMDKQAATRTERLLRSGTAG